MTIALEFDRIVKKNSLKIALKSETEGELSYNDLNHYANNIANFVLSEVKGSHKVIGICFNRSFKMIASMLGLLKAGYTYLPLDPAYPCERISYMLENSKVSIIICDINSSDSVPDGFYKVVIPDLHYISDKEFSCKNASSLAYIQYTSGSTGNPRGVMISNKSIMNTLMWRINYYNLSEKDTVLQIPSYSFASSVEDIFSTLLSGGTLVLIKSKDLQNMNYLKHLISKYAVTHFLMVPSLYSQLINQLRNNSSLRFVVIAGEPFAKALIQRHYEILPQVHLYNEYGMTETSVACSAYKIESNDEANIIGRLLPNMKSLISDKDDDGIGELYISGIGLADGYHNDRTASEERFVYINNDRYFRTGDYVKQCFDGRFLYHGRKDSQIKVNGQRINFSEIDYALQTQNKVKQSITTSIKLGTKNKIISFVVSEEKDSTFFKDYLIKKLPRYYIPDIIKVINEFELLPNKKININKMKENIMKEINENILRNDPTIIELTKILYDLSDALITIPNLDVSIKEIGIDSISLIQFIAMVEEKFQFEFEYDEIDKVQYFSIVELSKYISNLKK